MNDDDLPQYSLCPDCGCGSEALYKEQQKVQHLQQELDSWRARQERSGSAAKDNLIAVTIERQLTDVERKRADATQIKLEHLTTALRRIAEPSTSPYVPSYQIAAEALRVAAGEPQ